MCAECMRVHFYACVYKEVFKNSPVLRKCLQIIANHHMQSISFASGGDPVSIFMARVILHLVITQNYFITKIFYNQKPKR